MIKNKNNRGWIFFPILLVASVIIYLYRLKWGMADVDESFYLSIPYRLIQGDALLAEEWNLSQLSAVLLYPILNVYLKIFHSAEGIILAFRLIYVVFQTVMAIVTYLLLKKKNEILAIGTSILYFLFTPFNIMALSYNTMSLMSLWLIVLLEISQIQRKGRYILEGVFLAFAVLCNPFVMIIYLLYIVVTILQVFLSKKNTLLRKAGYITIGAGCVLVLFLIFIFSRTTLEKIIQNIPMILNSPAHGTKGLEAFIYPILSFCEQFWWYTSSILVFFLLGLFFKPARKYCFYFLIVISAIASIYFAVALTNGPGYAIIMIPLTPLGLIAFCYSEEKDWNLFLGWIIGVLYALCMNMASNNGIYAISTGCTVSSCVSIFLIYEFTRVRYSIKECILMISIILCVQLFAESYVCLNHVFWEESPRQLDSEIDRGPLKGIVTVKEKKEEYEENYDNLIDIKQTFETEGKNVFLFKKFPCGYLVLNDMRMGAYSAWMSDIAEDLYDERINKYYEYHPEKDPDVIYIDSASATVWDDEQWKNYSSEQGYTLKKYSNGAYCLIK